MKKYINLNLILAILCASVGGFLASSNRDNIFALGLFLLAMALVLISQALYDMLITTINEPALYSKEWFIRKFEAIPDKKIGKGSLSNNCGLYHCGVRFGEMDYTITEEAAHLIRLFGGETDTDYPVVYDVNDNLNKKYEGATPKQRLLNKLKSLP